MFAGRAQQLFLCLKGEAATRPRRRIKGQQKHTRVNQLEEAGVTTARDEQQAQQGQHEVAAASSNGTDSKVSDGRAKSAADRKRTRHLGEDKAFRIFSGGANRQLAEEICRHIGAPLGETKLQRFADGEIYFQLLENVRGADVFVVQPTCKPVDFFLLYLLIMIYSL